MKWLLNRIFKFTYRFGWTGYDVEQDKSRVDCMDDKRAGQKHVEKKSFGENSSPQNRQNNGGQ